MSKEVLSWGRAHRFDHAVERPRSAEALRRAAAELGDGELGLAYGLGRSYGDSCLNEGGRLIVTQALDRFIAFDRERGVIRCDAGVSLADILKIAGPSGWFLPATPGTKFVTVGGAIANDVHGKNHHRAGTFGAHVLRFELLRSDGGAVLCAPDSHEELFRATIGGLGLTGVISWAEIQLKSVDSLMLDAEDIRFEDLDEFFEISRASQLDWEYVVGWIDCASGGDTDRFRGILSRANHAPVLAGAAPRKEKPTVGLPFVGPPGLVNRLTVRAFNALYVRKAPTVPQLRRIDYEPFFYPLDAVLNWNRIYGPKGFYQHQCVIPPEAAKAGVAELCRRIARGGGGSPLTVLKLFGPAASPGLMSFPEEGATLAIDFPNAGARTLELLDDLDAIVVGYGGRTYPAKDGRMSAATFQRGYPNWREFAAHVDPGLSSSFWRRVSVDLG
ncbi:MAG: FAD-binding oxidoreductase [Pseudomonadota bacterium]